MLSNLITPFLYTLNASLLDTPDVPIPTLNIVSVETIPDAEPLIVSEK